MIETQEFNTDNAVNSGVKTVGALAGFALSDGLAHMPGKQNKATTRGILGGIGLLGATIISDETSFGNFLSSLGAGMAGGQVLGLYRDNARKKPPTVKNPAEPTMAEKFLRGMAGIETVDPKRDEQDKNQGVASPGYYDATDDMDFWANYEQQAQIQSSNSAA